jgi:hypothetical protein
LQEQKYVKKFATAVERQEKLREKNGGLLRNTEHPSQVRFQLLFEPQAPLVDTLLLLHRSVGGGHGTITCSCC